MTQKEIDKFLANTKVYVNGKSKEIQEKLFSLGYFWSQQNSRFVSNTQYPFLHIDGSKTLLYSSNMEAFARSEEKEITAEEILSLELTPSTYRPFKDKDECWQEMLKHQPFGWIRGKYLNYYRNIVIVNDCEIELTPYYTDEGENLQDIILHKYAIKKYTFADGTPFGIRED